MEDNAASVEEYFANLGFGLRYEERDLHAEYMAQGEPGQASFFVADRRHVCVDLMRGGEVVAESYAHAESIEEASKRAKQRFESEQR